ncbi:MAG TPA: hypothetical protein VJB95_00285 [Candidatus Paceibacterota bacterium]
MRSALSKLPLLISFIFLALSAVVFFSLYRAVNKNIVLAEGAEAVWQKEMSRQNDIKSLQNSIRLIDKEKEELTAHFIASSDVVPLLDMLERLAREVGAKGEITFVDNGGGNAGLTVSLRAAGSFESIYKFIRLLENSPYELEFTFLDLKKLDTKTPSWEASIRVKLLTFAQ